MATTGGPPTVDDWIMPIIVSQQCWAPERPKKGVLGVYWADRGTEHPVHIDILSQHLSEDPDEDEYTLVLPLDKDFDLSTASDLDKELFAKKCMIAQLPECQVDAAARCLDKETFLRFKARCVPQKTSEDEEDDDMTDATRPVTCLEKKRFPRLWDEVVETLSSIERFRTTARIWADEEEIRLIDKNSRFCWPLTHVACDDDSILLRLLYPGYKDSVTQEYSAELTLKHDQRYGQVDAAAQAALARFKSKTAIRDPEIGSMDMLDGLASINAVEAGSRPQRFNLKSIEDFGKSLESLSGWNPTDDKTDATIAGPAKKVAATNRPVNTDEVSISASLRALATGKLDRPSKKRRTEVIGPWKVSAIASTRYREPTQQPKPRWLIKFLKEVLDVIIAEIREVEADPARTIMKPDLDGINNILDFICINFERVAEDAEGEDEDDAGENNDSEEEDAMDDDHNGMNEESDEMSGGGGNLMYASKDEQVADDASAAHDTASMTDKVLVPETDLYEEL